MTSVFLERNHLFGRHPHGGNTDFGLQAAAGFGIFLANVGDFPPEEWLEHRAGATEAGMLCCPWLRTADGNHQWDVHKLEYLLAIADEWGTPVLVNSEKELDGSGGTLTDLIAEMVGDRDAAISMQAWPFDSVDWSPVAHLPMLPQLFNADSAAARDDPAGCVAQWHKRLGGGCVVPTFGAYGGQGPDDSLERLSPYGCYTADDMAQQYAPWSPEGTTNPCTNGGEPEPMPPPADNTIPTPAPGEPIGTEHGITALVDWLQKQPGMPTRSSSYNPTKPGTWPWPERVERTLRILAADHDTPPPKGTPMRVTFSLTELLLALILIALIVHTVHAW